MTTLSFNYNHQNSIMDNVIEFSLLFQKDFNRLITIKTKAKKKPVKNKK